jgi:uncharacterized membrane protein YciS (DUF1049 family)
MVACLCFRIKINMNKKEKEMKRNKKQKEIKRNEKK